MHEHCRTLGTLCWCCLNAYDGCCWSSRFQPVRGWAALRLDNSFTVLRCPLFRLEDRFEQEYFRFLKKSKSLLREVR
ncbi:MAG: hypothetical protein K2O18_04700, partial [Oscillospiraceae bacterium]|nr:hypothetical protein [Oscillospiraceae bacterium]